SPGDAGPSLGLPAGAADGVRHDRLGRGNGLKAPEPTSATQGATAQAATPEPPPEPAAQPAAPAPPQPPPPHPPAAPPPRPSPPPPPPTTRESGMIARSATG